MRTVYLDHNATTPADPEVVEAMLPYLTGTFGNASSVHSSGREAKVALEQARESIASFINCEPSELFFTSGGTESDNIAILGTAAHLKARRNHLVVGAAEHHAVIEPAEHLSHAQGFALDLLPVDSDGLASPSELAEVVADKTALVSVMHANNETGTIQDIEALTSAAHERGVVFHTDAVQSIGKIEVDVKKLDVDMLSLTGHKIYGPKGTGALFVRTGIKFVPLFYGGAHERKRRPGTENVAGAVGLATALQIAVRRREDDFRTMSELTGFFIDAATTSIPACRMNGSRESRIPQTVNLSFDGIEGEAVVLNLDLQGVAASSGSACTSGAIEPSHVLVAMGVPPVSAQGAVRFSVGRATTREDLEYVLEILPPIVQRLREMSPLWDRRT